MSRVNRRVLVVAGTVVLAAAVVAASVLIWWQRSFSASNTPMDGTAGVLAHELDVRIGQFGPTPSGDRLVVTLTNKRDIVGNFTVGVGGFQGDRTTQVAADMATAVLAPGATQQVELFTRVTPAVAQRLHQADFRVIGAWSTIQESRA